LWGLPAVRKEVGEVGVGGDVDAGEDVCEGLDRVHPGSGSRDHEGVEEREFLSGIFAVHKEEVLFTEGDDSDRVFCAVVVERDASVAHCAPELSRVLPGVGVRVPERPDKRDEPVVFTPEIDRLGGEHDLHARSEAQHARAAAVTTPCAVVTGDAIGASPCGICRQVLAEFAKDMPVAVVGLGSREGETGRVVQLAELLPFAFAFAFAFVFEFDSRAHDEANEPEESTPKSCSIGSSEGTACTLLVPFGIVPTALRTGPYRLYFYSHEPNEPPHVHVDREDRSAKFWLIPVSLSSAIGFTPRELAAIERLVEQHQLSLLEAWNEHFGT
jgi:hypothetical protein